MIDQELPQIRTLHKITPEPISWIHSSDAHTKHGGVSELVSAKGEITPAMSSNNDGSSEPSVVMLVSFLAGILAVVLVVRMSRRYHRSHEYTPLPNTNNK